MQPWQADKKWADKYWPEIERVVRLVAGDIIDVQQADDESDQKFATDYVVSVSSGNIACRVRRWKHWEKHADFTIRSWRRSGHKTELEKIREGFGRWYLYAWAKDNNAFGIWIFIDLDKLRTSGLLENRKEIMNPDGNSGFINIPLWELSSCIIRMGE